MFSPLCCTVPCIKYSAPTLTQRTILVLLPTNSLYLMTDYKRACRELWSLTNCLLNPCSCFSRVEDVNSPLLWCKVWESNLKSAPTNCYFIDGFSLHTLSQTAAGAAILHLLHPDPAYKPAAAIWEQSPANNTLNSPISSCMKPVA